ncbi:MAG: hypothetical protein U0Z75_01060 [Deinococcaceae bacterium]
MSKSLYSDLRGKSIEDIIKHPSLWAKYMDLASRSSDITGSLTQLLSKVQAIHGPVARARQAQVMLGLDQPFEEIEQVLTPYLHHPLCKSMHLMAIFGCHTIEAYQYVAAQSEFVVTTRLEIPDREAQLRWDFVRAQGLQGAGRFVEALNFYTIAHRTALDLGINSIATFSLSQINFLTSDSPETRIESLLLQLEQAEKHEDYRIFNPLRYLICTQYMYLEDYQSALDYAQRIFSIHPMKQHLVQGSRLLLGLPMTEELPSLEGVEWHAFSVMTHVLMDFQKLKRYIEVFGNREDVEELANKVLGYTISVDLDIPMAAVIAMCLQAMTYATSGDIQNARNILSNAVKLTKNTQNIPKWSERFTSLTEFFIAYKEQKATHPQFGENILVGLEKSASFQTFVTEYCPDAIFLLHNEQRTTITEKLMGKVLSFEPISQYLSNHPDIAKLGKNPTESDILKSKIDILENRLEEAKDNNDIRARDCTLYGLCVLSALNDDYPAFMEYAKGFMDSEMKRHLILFAKFFANENPGYQLPESFGPEDQPFYSLTRLLLTFKQYNWHYRNSHHNPEYENMRNSILNWEIPETLDVPLTNLMSLTLKILVYLMNWDVKTPKPLMQKMRDIMKTVKLTETERYYVWLAEGMLEYQTKQRMKSMYVSIIEKGIEKQKSFQWFVVQTCPQILIYLEKHGKSKVVKKLAKDTLKRWAGPSGPRWA